MTNDCKEVLISEIQIKHRVKELAEAITKTYAEQDNLLVVGILKGSVVFLSDLIREMNIPLEIDFMDVSSYGNGTKSSGAVKIIKDLDFDIKDKRILIVEDIIDTGLTLSYLIQNLKSRSPVDVKICTLLNKPSRRLVDIEIDFNGIDIRDEFVVGYGLDYAGKYRNLPFIGVLKPEKYE